MKLNEQTSHYQSRRSSRFDTRWVLSIVLSIAVLLGQSMPAVAGHGSGSSAGWIEICGDGGSYFVQIDKNGQKKAPECVHCDFCLVPSGDTQGVHSTLLSASALTDFTTVSYLFDLAVLPDSPEQYWSACRGPPIASVENNMIPIVSLSVKEPAALVLNTWSTPCV